MRRLLAILTLSLAGALVAAPVLAAAETIHWRGEGNSAGATFSDVPWDQEQIPPGTYFYTDVFGADSFGGPAGDTVGEGACVFHETFMIDASGLWQTIDYFNACAEGADLVVSNRLTGASLQAEVPLETCADPECLEIVFLGTVMIDLAWTGEGPINRWHGTGTGGSAGNYQYSYHGTGTGRAASPSGTIVLVAPDGSTTDLTGGLDGDGYMSRSRNGSVDVIITRGGR